MSAPLPNLDIPAWHPAHGHAPSNTAHQCPRCHAIAYNPICPICAETERERMSEPRYDIRVTVTDSTTGEEKATRLQRIYANDIPNTEHGPDPDMAIIRSIGQLAGELSLHIARSTP
jgi:hypothetical protein